MAEVTHPPTAATVLKGTVDYLRREPLTALLFVALIATIVYFYGFFPFFSGMPVAVWASTYWGPGTNQEHSWVVPFIFGFLVWYHREKLRHAPKNGSNLGLLFVGIGVFCYFASARTLQVRLALLGIPFLLFGVILHIWGKHVARILAFPTACLFFLIPMTALEQTSFRLQFIVTGAVTFLSSLIGLSIRAIGTTLTATDGSFNFEIAEGCSGIRSLIAMVMLSGIYAHLFQDRLWKKAAVVLASGLFAIIGNIGRIFTIIIIAKLGYPDFAAGIYHDYSAFIFFPIALASMVAFSNMLNIRLQQWSQARPVTAQEEIP
jgi:exosortase